MLKSVQDPQFLVALVLSEKVSAVLRPVSRSLQKLVAILWTQCRRYLPHSQSFIRGVKMRKVSLLRCLKRQCFLPKKLEWPEKTCTQFLEQSVSQGSDPMLVEPIKQPLIIIVSICFFLFLMKLLEIWK